MSLFRGSEKMVFATVGTTSFTALAARLERLGIDLSLDEDSRAPVLEDDWVVVDEDAAPATACATRP